MRKLQKLLLAALVSQLFGCSGDVAPDLFVSAGEGRASVIYGENSIKDISKEAPNSANSVSLFKKEEFNRYFHDNQFYRVEEVFEVGDLSWKDQPTVAFCSGVLVAPDLVLTAAHCVSEASACEDLMMALDYELENANKKTLIIPVSCKEIVKKSNAHGLDYALIRLETKMGRKPPTMRSRAVKIKEKIYTVGYPLGSFKKQADGVVRSINKNKTFVSTLDVFGGNSGSPVYSNEDDSLLGILSSGESDFETDYSNDVTTKIKRCSNSGCIGETIIPIEAILSDINEGRQVGAPSGRSKTYRDLEKTGTEEVFKEKRRRGARRSQI